MLLKTAVSYLVSDFQISTFLIAPILRNILYISPTLKLNSLRKQILFDFVLKRGKKRDEIEKEIKRVTIRADYTYTL